MDSKLPWLSSLKLLFDQPWFLLNLGQKLDLTFELFWKLNSWSEFNFFFDLWPLIFLIFELLQIDLLDLWTFTNWSSWSLIFSKVDLRDLWFAWSLICLTFDLGDIWSERSRLHETAFSSVLDSTLFRRNPYWICEDLKLVKIVPKTLLNFDDNFST